MLEYDVLTFWWFGANTLIPVPAWTLTPQRDDAMVAES